MCVCVSLMHSFEVCVAHAKNKCCRQAWNDETSVRSCVFLSITDRHQSTASNTPVGLRSAALSQTHLMFSSHAMD